MQAPKLYTLQSTTCRSGARCIPTMPTFAALSLLTEPAVVSRPECGAMVRREG